MFLLRLKRLSVFCQAELARLVEEKNEISRYPGVEVTLVDALLSYESHVKQEGIRKFRIEAQFPVMQTESCAQS